MSENIQYFENKIIMRPDNFMHHNDFIAYGHLAASVAHDCGIGLFKDDAFKTEPRMRDVTFWDTAGFQLRQHKLMLRKRVPYERGFPVPDPEVTLKFRSPNMYDDVDTTVRIGGPYRVKYKVESLPSEDREQGVRYLFEHNIQVPYSELPDGTMDSLTNLAKVFPAVGSVGFAKIPGAARLELVNSLIVEEVLQDLGTLGFGHGITAESNIALWRDRATGKGLCAEYAFEIKHLKAGLPGHAAERLRTFFIEMQSRSNLLLGQTKTEIVYGGV